MPTACVEGLKTIHWKLWEKLITQKLYIKCDEPDRQTHRQTEYFVTGARKQRNNHQCYIVNDNWQNVLGIPNNKRSNRGQNQFAIIALRWCLKIIYKCSIENLMYRLIHTVDVPFLVPTIMAFKTWLVKYYLKQMLFLRQNIETSINKIS